MGLGLLGKEYQALVLLSIPGIDFNGGELYVQNGRFPETGIPPVNKTSNFANGGSAGDVVVFKANNLDDVGDFYHGMTTVKKGKDNKCERWCIGLFQPPDGGNTKNSSSKKRKRK